MNKYYEKNLTTGTVTTYYYLGDKLVALRNGSNLRYSDLDHLSGTNVVTNSSGSQLGYIRYYPYGSTRSSSGSLDTDKKFTGQRLDDTGLYYYGARYYDPSIGRFISPDPVVPGPANPQALNRYSYVMNNPLKYVDPSGLDYILVGGSGSTQSGIIKSWAKLMAYLGYEGEKIIILPDCDPDRLPFDPYNVEPRIQQLMDVLTNEELTDIKIIGFSEGAAAVGVFLSRLAKNRDIISASVRDELRAAVLLECPAAGLPDLVVEGFKRGDLDNIPSDLFKAGIKINLVDVWNKASIVHGGELTGWEGYSKPYDSRNWFERGLSRFGNWIRLGLVVDIARAALTSPLHSNVLGSEHTMRVVKGTLNN